MDELGSEVAIDANSKLSRREREEEERRQLIMTVAEQLFAQNGFHNTSVSDIARQAEFGIGTIYRHFKDKGALFQALLDARINEHFDEVETALADNDIPRARLDRLIDTYMESYKKREDFFLVYYTYVHPQACHDGFVGVDIQNVRARQERMRDELRGIIAQGIASGNFVDVDVDYLVAYLYGGLVSFFYMARNKFESEWLLDDMKHAFKRVLFGGLTKKAE